MLACMYMFMCVYVCNTYYVYRRKYQRFAGGYIAIYIDHTEKHYI